MNFIRQELNYLEHVRDQAMADVFIQVNQVGNAAGGTSFELIFKGQKEFKGTDQHLEYQALPTATYDEIRRALVERIEVGLVPYLLQTDLVERLRITMEAGSDEDSVESLPSDPWNFWIFEIYAEGELEKESSDQQVNMEVGLAANRTTHLWRFRSRGEINYDHRRFANEDTRFSTIRRVNYLNASLVRSLGDHWSAGLFGEINHDTYRNIRLSTALSPAVEYSIYPYDEVIRREFVFFYRLGALYNQYLEPTIFEKNQEWLLQQAAGLNARFQQPWGYVSASLEVANYLHDFSKFHIESYNYCDIRLWKGLAFRLSANVQFIRDQISLPKGDASIEDILLRQRQIATNFYLEVGLGVSYTFGSAYNSVVNTRL